MISTSTAVAASYPSTDREEESDYELVTANINFLRRGLKGDIKIMPKNGETRAVNIHCYSNVEKLRSDFNFHDNGFQYCGLEGDLLRALNQFAAAPFLKNNRSELLNASTQFLSSWGKENGIRGVAVPLNLMYRSTNPDAKATKPFFFAHVDFDERDMARTLRTNENNWKANVETVLGELPREKYENLKINVMANLWMQLNEYPTVNTLPIMDTSSTENLSEESQPALTPVGKTMTATSLGLHTNPNQKWVVQTAMTRGSGVIFRTTKTFHTAADIEGRFHGEQCDPHRESVEVRVGWVDLS